MYCTFMEANNRRFRSIKSRANWRVRKPPASTVKKPLSVRKYRFRALEIKHFPSRACPRTPPGGVNSLFKKILDPPVMQACLSFFKNIFCVASFIVTYVHTILIGFTFCQLTKYLQIFTIISNLKFQNYEIVLQ